MDDFYAHAQAELIEDVSMSLTAILQSSGGSNCEAVKARLMSALGHNQALHRSRTAFVNYFKNRIFAHDPQMRAALNHLCLVAAVNEGIINDIDNRLDGHETDLFDSCFLEAYAPLILQKAVQLFMEQARELLTTEARLHDELNWLIWERTFTFLNEINQIPLIEAKLVQGKTDHLDDDLKELIKLKAQQTTISVFIIFYPAVLMQKLDTRSYRHLFSFFEALHVMEDLHKDLLDAEDDQQSGRFNAWVLLRGNGYKRQVNVFVRRAQEILWHLNLIAPQQYPSLRDFLSALQQRRLHLARILSLASHMGEASMPLPRCRTLESGKMALTLGRQVPAYAA
ncbi:MAG: hypothetical protein JSV36_10500 [Anaerolineae bacterium]|nr:MAG: hypothetical protein JSV36_10500 [Anaerolineae bacterium]